MQHVQKAFSILLLALLSVTTVYAGTMRQTDTIQYGETVSGTITDDNFEDRYQFNGGAGDQISIVMQAAENSLLDTYLILLDPAGEVLAENDDLDFSTTDSRLIDLELPANGIYTIIASRFQAETGSTEGDYTLSVESSNTATDTPPQPPDTDSNTLRYGETVTGTIDNDKYEIRYIFEGTAGDVLNIQLSTLPDSGLDTVLLMLDTEGLLFTENDDANLNTTDSALTDITLPESGNYTLIVTRYLGEDGVSEGSFELSLEQVNSEEPATPDTPDEPTTSDENLLVYGDTVRGLIDNETYEHEYRFEAVAGDQITIRLEAAPDSSLDTYLVLLDPADEIIASNDDTILAVDTNSTLENITLPEDGIYTIVATRYNFDEGASIGPFTLTLERATGESNAEASEYISLSYGETVEGTITDAVPSVVYRFEGMAGERITVQMNATNNSDLDTFLIVQTTAGELVEFNDDSELAANTDSLIESLELPETGTYYIIATRYQQEEGITTGDFRLTLESDTQTDTPPVVTDPAETMTIDYGETVEGRITGEVFEFRYHFEATTGDRITIEMIAADGSSLDPYLILLAPDNTAVAENDDADLSTIDAALRDLEILNGGTYTIIATRFLGQEGATIGDFTLLLTAISDTPPPVTGNEDSNDDATLGYGETVSGVIDTDNLVRRYTFTGQAGDRVTITMQSTDGNLDTYLSLLDAEGNELAFNDDFIEKSTSVIEDFVLPQDGEYTIVATRYGVRYGATEGTFELTLE